MVHWTNKPSYNFQDLQEIVGILRHPGGCAWDMEQTHASIRRNFLEEAYEVAEAIDEGDPEHLKEELGDVLLQVVFHTSIEEDAGRFDLDAVADGICKKLIYRHPHVFGTVEARDPEGALSAWDAQKRAEKGQKTAADALDSVARALPGLTRASKLQSKAAKAGFDWEEVSPALDKLSEELEELKTAIREGSNVEEELGDLLFAAVKVGRFVQVDGEQALQGACEKFIRRFRRVEQLAEGPMDGLGLPALEALWRQAKEEEKRA